MFHAAVCSLYECQRCIHMVFCQHPVQLSCAYTLSLTSFVPVWLSILSPSITSHLHDDNAVIYTNFTLVSLDIQLHSLSSFGTAINVYTYLFDNVVGCGYPQRHVHNLKRICTILYMQRKLKRDYWFCGKEEADNGCVNLSSRESLRGKWPVQSSAERSLWGGSHT